MKIKATNPGSVKKCRMETKKNWLDSKVGGWSLATSDANSEFYRKRIEVSNEKKKRAESEIGLPVPRLPNG